MDLSTTFHSYPRRIFTNRLIAPLSCVLALFFAAGCGEDGSTNGPTGSSGSGDGGSGGSGGSGGGSGGGGPDERPAALLIANSRGDDIAIVNPESGEYLGTLVGSGQGELFHPDALVIGPDGALYVASGDKPENSAVLRYNVLTGQPLGKFAEGGGLYRPYGIAFGPDGKLYVSSFLTDQILRYDAMTGEFVDIFAEGDGMAGGLNGPNALLFGSDGKLYVTTEGSVAVNGEATFPGLPSQVLRFDIETGDSEVFADQPEMSPAGLGFVSLLGLAFGPDCKAGACDLFVSDFAHDIRRYDAATGTLKQTISTNYGGAVPAKSFVGGIVFGEGGELFVTAFNNEEGQNNKGVVLRFDGATGNPLPGMGNTGAILLPEDARLNRPIGITIRPSAP